MSWESWSWPSDTQQGPSPVGTAEATCQAPWNGPQGHLSSSLWITPDSAPPPHWCSHSPKGSVCPYAEGKGLVGEGAASEGGGLVLACGMEQAELRARVCKLLEAVPKQGTGKRPKPASTWPPKTSHASQPLCHPAHTAPVWSPCCSATRFVFAMWLDHPSSQLCWSCRARGVLAPPDQSGSWARRAASSKGSVPASPAVL